MTHVNGSRPVVTQSAEFAVPLDQFLAAIVESSDDAIIGKTLDGIITSWNPGAVRLYGYTADEAIGQPISLIIPADRADELSTIMEHLRNDQRIDHVETTRVSKDGTRLQVSVSIAPLHDETGRIVGAACIGHNITELLRSTRERRALQRQAQQEQAARNESEERLRAVWDATSEALALSDPNGIVLDVNPAYCVLYGRQAEEFVGHSFAIIFPEDERPAAEAQYVAIFTAPDLPSSYEARIRRPDGTDRVVESRADFLVHEGQRVAMVSALRDITERKRLEQAQLDFVAMASHDLASPLTVLRARAQLLQRRQRYDEESVTAILEQTDRMGRLIDDLRALAQVEGGGMSLQLEAIDLGEIAQGAVERARILQSGHIIQSVLPRDPQIVSGDRDRLGQVFDNLIGNAIKYSQADSEIVVRIERIGDEAHVRIADQGAGIPPDELPALFDRFVRGTHVSKDAGLGLGLYITRMLVEAHHGGRVWATSQLGQGSVFTVALSILE
jgi:PAS domain S-box-containing protein